MSLSEKLRKKKVPQEIVTIDGERYSVRGLSLNDTASVLAKCRKGKDQKLDGDKFDRTLLASCVCDPDDASTATADEWGEAPRSVTGPLMGVVMNLCGLDKDDVQRDPKDSDSTES